MVWIYLVQVSTCTWAFSLYEYTTISIFKTHFESSQKYESTQSTNCGNMTVASYTRDPWFGSILGTLMARSDGLRKMQWDREFSNSLHFLHVYKIGLSYCVNACELCRSEWALTNNNLLLRKYRPQDIFRIGTLVIQQLFPANICKSLIILSSERFALLSVWPEKIAKCL